MKGRNKDKLCDVCTVIVPTYSYDELIDKTLEHMNGSFIGDEKFSMMVFAVAVNTLRHDTIVIFPKEGRLSWQDWTNQRSHMTHIYRDLKLKILWDLMQAYSVNHSMKREFKRQIKDTKAIDVSSAFAYN